MKIRKVYSILLLVLATLIWGSTFPLVKATLRFINEFQLLFLRFGFSSIIGIFIIVRFHNFLKDKKLLILLTLLGFSLFIAYVFQTAGLKYTTPSKSAFITGLYIVFTPILASVFLKEKVKKEIIFALVLSLAGLMLLSHIDLRDLSSINRGDVLTFLCAISFAFQIVLTEMLVKNLPSLFVTSFELVVSFLFSIPFVFNAPISLTPFVLASALFLGIFASFFAIQTESFALMHIDSTEASLIFVLEPVFAYLFSYLLLKEHLTLRGIIGALLILASMIIVSFYNRE